MFVGYINCVCICVFFFCVGVCLCMMEVCEAVLVSHFEGDKWGKGFKEDVE